jgi:UDP-glucose 4-epimerase
MWPRRIRSSSSICVIINVAGADPNLRTGQSTVGATHLIKVAVETALGLRPHIEVFGTERAADGTCPIYITGLATTHGAGDHCHTFNCGY